MLIINPEVSGIINKKAYATNITKGQENARIAHP